MDNILISVSTPNKRGIHNYSLSILKLIKNKYSTNFLFPKNYKHDQLKIKKFLDQILWELFSVKKNTLNEYKKFICIHPRFPLSIFLNFGKSKYKKGIVVFDYIQCMKLSNFFERIFFSNAKYNLFKNLYHTLLFKLSVLKADFIIFISRDTSQKLNGWVNENLYKSKKSIIIHPLPSFNEIDVMSVLHEKKDLINRSQDFIKFLFVTGNAESKRSQLILPILIQTAQKLPNKFLKATIIGKKISSLKNLPSNLELINPKDKVSDDFLINEYMTSNFFVSTSIKEGFGIPFLDAIAFDIFSVVSEIPTYKEIYEEYNNSNSCLIKDHNNAESYVAKIIETINNKKLLTGNGKNYIQEYRRIFQKSKTRLNDFLKQI